MPVNCRHIWFRALNPFAIINRALQKFSVLNDFYWKFQRRDNNFAELTAFLFVLHAIFVKLAQKIFNYLFKKTPLIFLNEQKPLEVCQKTYFCVMPWKTWSNCIKSRWWLWSRFQFFVQKEAKQLWRAVEQQNYDNCC